MSHGWFFGKDTKWTRDKQLLLNPTILQEDFTLHPPATEKKTRGTGILRVYLKGPKHAFLAGSGCGGLPSRFGHLGYGIYRTWQGGEDANMEGHDHDWQTKGDLYLTCIELSKQSCMFCILWFCWWNLSQFYLNQRCQSVMQRSSIHFQPTPVC